MNEKPEKAKNDGDEVQDREIISYSEEYYFQGTIPHPSLVEHYEQVMEGAADRIFTMAEKEQATRHKLRRWDLLLFHFGRLSGLLFAFIIALLTIGGGLFLLYHDKSITGMVTLLVGIASLVGSFIFREHKKKEANQTNPSASE